MSNKRFREMVKQVPLSIRLEVTIQAFFLNEYGGAILMPLDENGNGLPEAVEANKKCIEKAAPLIRDVLDAVKQWEKDKTNN